MGKVKVEQINKQEWQEEIDSQDLERITLAVGKIKACEAVVEKESKKEKRKSFLDGLRSERKSSVDSSSVSDMDEMLEGDKTALHRSCESGNVKVVHLLINKGASPNKVDGEELLPIHYAILNGHVDIAKFLLLKSNINLTTKEGRNCMHLAAFTGLDAFMSTLMTQNIDLKAKDKEGNTALHLAAMQKNIGAIKIILKHGKKKNMVDELLDITNNDSKKPGDVASDFSEEDQILLKSSKDFENFQQEQKDKKKKEKEEEGTKRVLVDNETMYSLLGVNKTATKKEMTKAYRKLAMKYHPDRNPDADPSYFMKISHAYELLSNEEKRAAYDEGGMNKVEDLKFENSTKVDLDDEKEAQKKDEEKRQYMKDKMNEKLKTRKEYTAEELQNMDQEELTELMRELFVSTDKTETKQNKVDAIINHQLEFLLQ